MLFPLTAAEVSRARLKAARRRNKEQRELLTSGSLSAQLTHALSVG